MTDYSTAFKNSNHGKCRGKKEPEIVVFQLLNFKYWEIDKMKYKLIRWMKDKLNYLSIRI